MRIFSRGVPVDRQRAVASSSIVTDRRCSPGRARPRFTLPTSTPAIRTGVRECTSGAPENTALTSYGVANGERPVTSAK